MVGVGVTANSGWVNVVPLLGAIAGAIVVCYGCGGGWRPTLGEWTSCQCWVPLQVPILFHIFLLYSGPLISPRHPRKQQWVLSWASCRRYTVLYIDNAKIDFGYLGSMLVLFLISSDRIQQVKIHSTHVMSCNMLRGGGVFRQESRVFLPLHQARENGIPTVSCNMWLVPTCLFTSRFFN